MIGRSDGELYHIWQRERDASWSDWEKIGGLPNSSFLSQPAMMFDDIGWWEAYGVRGREGEKGKERERRRETERKREREGERVREREGEKEEEEKKT